MFIMRLTILRMDERDWSIGKKVQVLKCRRRRKCNYDAKNVISKIEIPL